MSKYFKIETDVVQNLIDDFFSNFDCQMTFRKDLSEKKYVGTGLISEKKKTEALCVNLTKE